MGYVSISYKASTHPPRRNLPDPCDLHNHYLAAALVRPFRPGYSSGSFSSAAVIDFAKVIEVVIADAHRCKTVLRATLAPNAGSCMIMVMSFLALIREFDPETANVIENFWNRLPKNKTKKNIFEHNSMGTEVAGPELKQETEPKD